MAALRLALRQPPLSCNLVLCIERMAFASSSSCSSPPPAPKVSTPSCSSNDGAPADGATNPPPVEAPTTPCPCPGDGTHAPEPEGGKAGDVPPADDQRHRGPPITHGYYTPTHQPHDP